MRLHLTKDKKNGPWIDFADRALGYHNELIQHVATMELSAARKSAAYAGAMVRGAGGDFGVIDPSLEGYSPKLPTLVEYIEGDDATAYLTPRARLVSQMVPADELDGLADHCLGLIEVSPGESEAPED